MRYWTPEEANAALPDVAAKVERLRELLDRHRAIAGNGHVRDGEQGPPEEAIGALLAQLDGDGITVKDPERGIVDFAARSPSGREHWLCWLVTEPAVAFWHWPEDGFAGRQPITEPPA